MRTRNNKIATIFLLVLVMAPVCYIFSFHIQQQSIRHRMKEQLEGKMLRSVTLNGKDLLWAREGKEIIVDNRLFDVKTISYNEDGTALITGLFDEKETALVHELQKNQKENNSQGAKQLAQLFQLLLVIPENPQEEIVFPENISGGKFIPGTSPLASQFISIFTPPPQAF